jgi:hypothetical protein
MNLEQKHKQNTVICDSLSKVYAPLSTELILKPFLDRGWFVKKHLRSKGLGKEAITLKHLDYIYPNGDFLTVEFVNSRDGSAAGNLLGGYGRLLCNNGLVIGDLEHGRFIHRGTKIYERLENKYDKIVAHLDKIKQDVELLKSSTLEEELLHLAIEGIYKDVFEKNTKKYSVVADVNFYDIKKLLRVHREGDKATDAFTLLNVVQENIIRKGRLGCNITTINKETNSVERRFITKSPMENNVNSVKMNKIITSNFLKRVA